MAFVAFPATGRMKRNHVDDVSDEFSEFSLSAPARKMRRLDLGLAPIIEEEEPTIDIQRLHDDTDRVATPFEAEMSVTRNEEKALVLYNPLQQLSSLDSDSIPSFKIDSEILSAYDRQMLRPYGHSNEETKVQDGESSSSFDYKPTGSTSTTCMAVIPWTPSNISETRSTMDETTISNNSFESEAMDIEGGSSWMDVEEEHSLPNFSPSLSDAMGFNPQGVQQWQQQHCMDPPQVPTNSTTSVMWSW